MSRRFGIFSSLACGVPSAECHLRRPFWSELLTRFPSPCHALPLTYFRHRIKLRRAGRDDGFRRRRRIMARLVKTQRVRGPLFDLSNPSDIRWVGGKKFRNGRLRPEAEFADHISRASAHPFPKRNRFARIVPGLGHEPESDIIRFGFLSSIERQGDTDAVSAHGPHRNARINAPRRGAGNGAELRDLLQNAATHAFSAVAL